MGGGGDEVVWGHKCLNKSTFGIFFQCQVQNLNDTDDGRVECQKRKKI